MPITPAVLAWAIEQAGVDLATVAQRTSTDVDLVEEWLTGEVQPTKTQFRLLAAFLKRPEDLFLLPEPPVEASVPPAFRHPPGGEREATRTEIEAVRRAQRAQKVAAWTAERLGDQRWEGDPAPSAKGLTPAAAAARARDWLEWSTVDQCKEKSASAVVKAMRAALENKGVLALQLSLGADGCRGFSLFHAVKPLVAVNTHYNPEARLYSYVHELGHLMRRTDAICVGVGLTKAERWCEEFAAAFLIPRPALRDRVAERFGEGQPVRSIEEVRLLSRDFNVSLTAMAIRIDRLEWGQEDMFRLVPTDSDLKRPGGGPGVDNSRGAARLRELGEGYFELLLGAEQASVLGRQDVLRYLDVSENQLEGLSHEGVEPFAA